MSKAVFIFTFYRFANLWTMLGLLLFTFGIPILLVIGVGKLLSFTADDWPVEVIVSLITVAFTTPILPLLAAYIFVRNSIANAKSLNDGEYLALLFSRPLARSSYVFTKWVACSLAVFATVICQLLFFRFCLQFTGLESQPSIELADTASIFFNSLGATALILMIQSFPPRVGKVLYLSILYGSILLPLLFSSSSASAVSNGQYAFQSALSRVCTMVHSFLYASIDMSCYLDSVSFDWLPACVFLSNITLYLLVATWVMCHREFFYANE